jgi:hypothetical protein
MTREAGTESANVIATIPQPVPSSRTEGDGTVLIRSPSKRRPFGGLLEGWLSSSRRAERMTPASLYSVRNRIYICSPS